MLSWVMNLGFAGGGVPTAPVTEQAQPETLHQRTRQLHRPVTISLALLALLGLGR